MTEREQNHSEVKIVKLSPDDWYVLRDLKLRSLEQEPIAFEDYEQGKKRYLRRSEEEWRLRMTEDPRDGVTLYAQEGDEYVGMVNALRLDETSAIVQHMYVDSRGHRGKGIGRQLLTQLIDEIGKMGDIEKVYLAVVETQTAARNLYESIGFYEKRRGRAKRGKEIFGEIDMELEL